MGRSRYNYEQHIGEVFSHLTIKGMAPREYKPNGQIKAIKYICECECGKTCFPTAYDVVCGRTISCGCKRGTTNPERRIRRLAFMKAQFEAQNLKCTAKESEGKSIIALKLEATYNCPYPTELCVRSSAAHICCRECDHFDDCENACQNMPWKCGAKKFQKRGRPSKYDNK